MKNVRFKRSVNRFMRAIENPRGATQRRSAKRALAQARSPTRERVPEAVEQRREEVLPVREVTSRLGQKGLTRGPERGDEFDATDNCQAVV